MSPYMNFLQFLIFFEATFPVTIKFVNSLLSGIVQDGFSFYMKYIKQTFEEKHFKYLLTIMST